MFPPIKIETIFGLTDLINDDNAGIEEMVDLVLMDDNWEESTIEESTLFIYKLLDKLLDMKDDT